MKSAELREAYLRFFEEKGCKRMPSSSLIPDDPSLLLTTAGMVQFKPYFLQQKQLEAPYIGTTTVQKCVRTTDIDIIGRTGRHLSFFEMLGNFSFGEYFKEEMCAWALEFSTEVLHFPMEKLYFTVFEDDDEAIEIWKSLGVPESHITRLGEDDNFWTAGPTGPCGPCSELYYDQGEDVGCGSPDCAPGCDCDRFLEFWNCVFTQYDRQEDGTYLPLPKKNIDTGMGLERTAAILQGVTSNYETDILRGLISLGEKLSGKAYGQDADVDLALRIIADHSRAVTFMIADGIIPSNEGRGYVLRRLLRRAVRYGSVLGMDTPLLAPYIDAVIEEMGGVYPEIVENRELVQRIVLSEEERFNQTIRQGQVYLDAALEQLGEEKVLPGVTAFTLHDTYGFPLELTEEICAEHGVEVDIPGFDAEMEQQRTRARASAKDDAWGTYGSIFSDLLTQLGTTEFIGYGQDEGAAVVKALVVDGQCVDAIQAGTQAQVVLDKTPFYGEMGGQVGDTGTLQGEDSLFTVTNTTVPEKGIHAHQGVLESGSLKVGDEVQAGIDHMRRERIRRNHTATHILHWALRKVLGDHVKQAGSYVGPDRLRFDFTHFEAMTADQIAQVEELANQRIMEDHPVHTYETSLTTAREEGVTALFGEKYGEFVRVVDAGSFSKELCGGTHVGRTSEIGLLKVVSESSVGANMRRIEAVTSFEALAYLNGYEAELKAAAAELKAKPLEVVDRIKANQKKIKELESASRQKSMAEQTQSIAKLVEDAIDVGYPLVLARVDGLDGKSMRTVWDSVREMTKDQGALVLTSKTAEGKPMLLAAASKAAQDAGFDAGALIKVMAPAVDGSGGGKPAMAQAGGKDAAGLDKALDLAREALGLL